jgi:hypothetical protein
MADKTDAERKQITPADIKAKLNEIDGSVQTTAKAAAPVGIAVGAGAVVLLLILAYLFGKRRGGKRQTVVEIRRI